MVICLQASHVWIVMVLFGVFVPAVNAEGKKIFLRDIWPTREEIQAVERQFVIPAMFKEVYEKVEVRKQELYNTKLCLLSLNCD